MRWLRAARVAGTHCTAFAAARVDDTLSSRAHWHIALGSCGAAKRLRIYLLSGRQVERRGPVFTRRRWPGARRQICGIGIGRISARRIFRDPCARVPLRGRRRKRRSRPTNYQSPPGRADPNSTLAQAEKARPNFDVIKAVASGFRFRRTALPNLARPRCAIRVRRGFCQRIRQALARSIGWPGSFHPVGLCLRLLSKIATLR